MIVTDIDTQPPPAFPATQFIDLFQTVDVRAPRIINGEVDGRREKALCYIECYISIVENGIRKQIFILPNANVIAWIHANMLKIAWDSIFFEGIAFPDGKTRIWANYNQILGSCYLAEIETASITAL